VSQTTLEIAEKHSPPIIHNVRCCEDHGTVVTWFNVGL